MCGVMDFNWKGVFLVDWIRRDVSTELYSIVSRFPWLPAFVSRSLMWIDELYVT